jgi:predicted type IV restriction endonuclease
MMDDNLGQQESKEKAPNTIKELVERFEKHLSSYKGQGYNEAQLRQEFINPFFEALGWDVYNKSGAAPSYRDVIHEDAIKMGGGVKAPDYCFTLSGRRMFFVETKKPSVDITKDTHPAYQLRRYSWSAELPLSILTNFEEFAIYESRQKPKQGDKTNIERTVLITYKDYIEKWDGIASVFSKKAVLQGSFDRYIELAKKKRGTQEVDDEFLKEIEGWRDALATNIAIRNTQLSVRELNDAVQKTIDRIIFLRMCEDRGIEQYGQLLSLLERENIYPHLIKIYEKADEKYNSGLFHFKKERERSTPPDEITLKLTIDDKVLKDIIKHIYYPESPYEFSVLRPEILGNVYEQFLGKVIRLTEGHRAKVEEKPEVKKAGGVYYTPVYIVEYIVKNTVGKLCEGKTPKQIEKLHILDSSCGSGSFLLGAYSYLLKYHLNYYTNRKNPKSYKKQIYQRKDGQWFLTIKEKKRILLNNIFGVDIDSQAVEVTKLSLLLKVLEGESKDVYEKQQKLWTERVLPDLGDNIKCGNSLIGSDFYSSNQTNLIEDEEMININAFNWSSEFKEIMENGGFDVVIGNPPYRMLQPHNTTNDILNYLRKHFFAADFKVDFFHLFLQKGVSLLVKSNGYLGFIVPVTLLNNVYIENLRHWITERCCIENISVANDKVFTADVFTSVIILRTEPNDEKRENNDILTTIELNENFVNRDIKPSSKIKQKDLLKLQGYVWNILINDKNAKLIFKTIKNNKPLGEISKINRGLITGARDKYFSKSKLTNAYVPIIAGTDVCRYYNVPPSEFVLFERPSSAGGCWDKEMHNAPHKLVIRQIGQRPTASLIQEPLAVTGNIFTIQCNDLDKEKLILGIINSKFIYFFWKIMFTDFKVSFPQVTIFSLSQLPIHEINQENKSLNDKIVKYVEQMLDFHQRLNRANVDVEKTMFQRQIDAIDKQIDQLVYQLYGLSNTEIKLVEESIKDGG